MNDDEVRVYAKLLIGMSTDYSLGRIDKDLYLSNLRLAVDVLNPPPTVTDEEIEGFAKKTIAYHGCTEAYRDGIKSGAKFVLERLEPKRKMELFPDGD